MDIGGVLSYFSFQLLVPFLFTVAFVSFLWGVFLYFIAGGRDEELQEGGKTVMLYGLIAFVFMVLVWAFLRTLGAVSPF